MTIHRLYTDNGNRAGFWVQHRSWSNICALVQSIAGQTEGKLPDPPEPPTPDSPQVLMRAFDVRSGRPVTLSPASPKPERGHDRNYARIAEPYWNHPVRRFYRIQRQAKN